jgi:signal transduction histidine kinase
VVRAFNDMLQRLKASKKALDASHDDLEKRVAERTLQLVEEIRHRRQIEQDLIRAHDAAQSANRAKSEFLANMSHEIRTPLNAIMGFTDLLNQAPEMDLEERAKSLDIIHDSGKHLLHLIDDMLEMSVLASGQSSPSLASFSPKALLEEVSAFYREAAEKKGLGFDLVWTTPAPESAESDPVKVRQLLENLIGNAVKFTDHGHVKVFAGVDDVARTLTIDVSDTGIGIPDDKRQSIFETFSQVDMSVTRKYGGTGIGLALCRHIVRILGGQLSVRSTEGKGSTFSVILPLGAPESGRDSQQAAIAATGDGASARRRPLPGRTPPLETAESLANRPYPANGVLRIVAPPELTEARE